METNFNPFNGYSFFKTHNKTSFIWFSEKFQIKQTSLAILGIYKKNAILQQLLLPYTELRSIHLVFMIFHSLCVASACSLGL